MGNNRRKTCCICGHKASSKLSQKVINQSWRPSKSYEKDFECCFGPGAESRRGDICRSCRNCVNKYRNNRDKDYKDVLDSNINNANEDVNNAKPATATTSCNTGTNTDDHCLNKLSSFRISSALCDISNNVNNAGNINNSNTVITDSVTESESDPTITTTAPPNNVNDNVNNNNNDRLDDSVISVITALPVPCPSSPSSTEEPRPPSPQSQTPAHQSRLSSPGRKRTRDESPWPSRCIRTKNTRTLQIPDNGPPLYFLGYILPRNVVGRIMEFLPQSDDVINLIFNFILPVTDQSMKVMKDQHTIVQKEKMDLMNKLEKFIDIPEHGSTYSAPESCPRTVYDQ